MAASLLSLGSASAAESVTQFVLPNGMQVVVIPDHRAPVVTQMIWYKVGGMDDPAGHSGLAHFFEHMMFRGTKAEPGDSFSRLVARNGGEDNAFTTEDYTAFYVQIARDRLKLVMGLEADRMAHLELTDTGVKTERDVVLEERRMRVDNVPSSLAAEQVDAALYLSHPYGRPVIGWPDEVHRLGRAEAQDFYDRHYAPNNAILVEVGDVTPEDVKAAAAETLAKVPARALDPRAAYAEPARLGETRLAIARPDAGVPSFSRSWRVASYSEGRPGQAEALEILAALLGGDANAVLYRALVVEQKLATDAGASYDGDARNAGAFSVYATPRPGVTLPRLEHAIDAILAGFARTPPDASALAHIKIQLIANDVFRRDSQLQLATAYGQALAEGRSVADVQNWPRAIEAVGADAVRAAAAEQLVPRESVSLYLTPGPG
ncbi:MAG: pitrilysin family protein [Rhizomicrobium sp.]